jgi:hypothetical protein
MKLDDKGRCCGRKPIDYKGGAWNSPMQPQKFCTRCDRSFDRVSGEQIANWAWQQDGSGEWVSKKSSAGKTITVIR